MTYDKLLMVAGAVAVVFWPQIVEFAKHLRGVVPAGVPTLPRSAGPDRSQVVVQLLELQAAASDAGNAKAAGLIGQAVVELVAGSPAPKLGAKR